MNWSFNFYPAHSGGFVSTRVLDYNLKYDVLQTMIFLRLIKQYRYYGSQLKNELISILNLVVILKNCLFDTS